MAHRRAQELIQQAAARGGLAALRSIAPVAVTASLVEGVPLESPHLLLERSLSLGAVVHPLLDAVLTEAGAVRRGSRSYAVPVGPGAPPALLTTVLAALPQSVCYPASYAPMAAQADGFCHLNRYAAARILEAQLRDVVPAAASVDLTGLYRDHPRSSTTSPEPAAHAAVVVTVEPTQLVLKVCTDHLRLPRGAEDLEGVDLSLLPFTGGRSSVLLLPHEGVHVWEEARARGLLVVEQHAEGGVIRSLSALLSSSVSVHPVQGAPAEAVVVTGSEVGVHSPHPGPASARATSSRRVSAREALLAAEGALSAAAVVVDERVRDVGRMALAPAFDESVLGAEGEGPPPLRPYQREAVGVHLATSSGYVQASAPGLGKGHPLDTPVLTPRGWVRVGEVRVGDELVGSDGAPTRVRGVHPRGRLPVVRVVLTDGGSVVCDEDHLWTLRPREGSTAATWGAWETRALRDRLRTDPSEVWELPPLAAVELDTPRVPAARELGAALLVAGQTLGTRVRRLRPTALPGHVLTAPQASRRDLLGGVLGVACRACLGGRWEVTGPPPLLHQLRALVWSLGGLAALDATGNLRLRLAGTSAAGVAADVTAGPPDACCATCCAGACRDPGWEVLGWEEDLTARVVAGVEPAGEAEVVCLSVDAPDQLYVTTDFVLTHNTVVTLTAARARAAALAGEGGTGSELSPELARVRERLLAHTSRPDYRALVSVPAQIRSQWARDVARWFPEAQVATLTTRGDEVALTRLLAAPEPGPVLVVASYEMTVRHVDLLTQTRWHDLVCDEAVVLRNPASERSRALWRLRAVSQVAVALTGTPVDRSLDDLGRLVAWVRGEHSMFDGARLSQSHHVRDLDARAALQEALGPIVFRRDRSEIASELPPVETEVVLLDPSPAELRLATAARSELGRIYGRLVERIEAAADLDPSAEGYQAARRAIREARGAVLGGVTLARMAASDPHAVAASSSAGALLLASSGLVEAATRRIGTKRAQVVELCAQLVARGESVLLFTEFAAVAENLVADLRARPTAVGAVVGGQTDRARTRAAATFQDGPPSVLVCTSAAQEGMNLHRATVLVHYDLPWSPSALVQRQARADRIGATGTGLSVLVPVMAGTIEERMVAVVVARSALALAALDTSRGVDARTTELGRAVGPLVAAVSAAELDGDASMVTLARELLAGDLL